jgi:hypothetical protein
MTRNFGLTCLGPDRLASQAVNGQWVVISDSPIADLDMSGRVDIFMPRGHEAGYHILSEPYLSYIRWKTSESSRERILTSKPTL